MSFKYNCYTENTKEAREWLAISGHETPKNINGMYLCVVCDGTSITINDAHQLRIFEFTTEATNCLGNLPLFTALTAVRDDSDYMQYFTDGKE